MAETGTVFDVKSCDCFDNNDKKRMLAAIEPHPSGAIGFNAVVHHMATDLVSRSRIRRPLASMSAPSHALSHDDRNGDASLDSGGMATSLSGQRRRPWDFSSHDRRACHRRCVRLVDVRGDGKGEPGHESVLPIIALSIIHV